ncbi:MAG: hypothetical protein U1E27_04355 [Kiritimatiellia bacterium]|nr:hypothetical protein [Kiritimatiellia bacterium]
MKTSDVSLSDRARIHGAPGVSPRIRALLRLMLPVAGFSAAAGWLLCAIRPPPGLPSSLAALLLVLLALGAAVFLVRSRDRLGDYLKGALGEQRTAYELAGLDKDFDVFHGLPLLGGQIAD